MKFHLRGVHNLGRRLPHSSRTDPQLQLLLATTKTQSRYSVAAASTLSACQNHNENGKCAGDTHTHGSGNLPFLSVAAMATAALLATHNSKTTTEPPQTPKQAVPIDWNVVFTMNRDADDDNNDDDSDPGDNGDKKDCCSKKKKEEKSRTSNDDNDDEEEGDNTNDIPSYIAEWARKDLGNSLNRHAPLGTEARNILRTEAQYPLQRADLTMAPRVPPPCNRNYPVHLVVDLMTVNKKMRVQGSKTYEFWPFAFLDQHDGRVKYSVPGPFIRGEFPSC